MYFSAGLMKSGRIRDYLGAGIAAGIGVASKYWAPTVVPLIVAHLIRLTSNRTMGWKENKKLLLSLFLAGISFFILSPYVILDAGTAIPKILWWAKKTTGEIPQIWAYHFEGTIPYLFQITHNIPWALGWPLAILSGSGFIFILIRHRKEDILLAAWIIINFLLIGSWYIKSIRYILPIIPFLCLCGAVLISRLILNRRLRVIGIAATLIAFFWSAIFSLAFIHIYSVKHSKTRASEWIYENIPPGAKLATNRSIPLGSRNGLPDTFEDEGLDFTYLFESSLPPSAKEKYLDEILDRNDYLVIADEFMEYFKNAESDHLPEKTFLENLFAGRKDFTLIKTFKVYPRLGEWILNDDGAELSFHYFDHPGIYIFKRNNEIPFEK